MDDRPARLVSLAFLTRKGQLEKKAWTGLAIAESAKINRVTSKYHSKLGMNHNRNGVEELVVVFLIPIVYLHGAQTYPYSQGNWDHGGAPGPGHVPKGPVGDV